MPRRLLAYYTPDQITGLVTWLKADALALVDADPVASWTDSSGNSNSPVQATGAAKPTYKTNIINGLPVVRFDGGDRLAMPDETQFDIATSTIFAVFKRTSGTSGTVMSKNTTGTGGAGRRKLQIATTSTSLYYASGADGANIAVTATPSNWNMFGVVTRGDSDHSIFLNGVQTDSVAALGDSTTNNAAMEIGAAFSNGAEAFTGDIAEIIVYNAPLGLLQIVGIENYLAAKYNLTVDSALGGTARAAISSRTHIPAIPGVRLDGVDDYIDIGTLGSFGTGLNNDGLVSIAFRMRTDSTSSAALFGTSNGGVNTTLAIFMNRNSAGVATANKMNVFIRNNSNVFQNVGTTNTIGLADGSIHHYVVQRVSRYVWEIWQDGVSMTMTNPSASGDLTAGFTNFSNSVGIGASNNGSWNSFAPIDISEVVICQRALDATEIANLYAGTLPSTPFRVFNLNQGGNIAIDTSSNAVNGIISGAASVSPRRLAGSSIAS